MDDYSAHSSFSSFKRNIFRVFEKRIIEKADLTIFTAEHLKKTITARMGFPFKSIILHNAIDLPENNISGNEKLKKIFATKIKRTITYLGLVSEWFDYNLLAQIVRKNKNLVFYLFGPKLKQFPDEDGIFFFGPQNHEDIFYIMEQSDALIMPFHVNELIKSVNPVKMYEYIYSGKPVISVDYEEMSLFKDFVYLYEYGDTGSLINIFNVLENNNYTAKKSLDECRSFASQNTWEKRAEELDKYLKEIQNS